MSSKKAPAGSQLKSVSSSSRPHGFLHSSRATKTPGNSRLLTVLGPADAQADIPRTLSSTDMSCPVCKNSDDRASRARRSPWHWTAPIPLETWSMPVRCRKPSATPSPSPHQDRFFDPQYRNETRSVKIFASPSLCLYVPVFVPPCCAALSAGEEGM